MQTVSSLYRQLWSGAHFVQFKAEINGMEYTQTELLEGQATAALFEHFSIGNAVARTLKLKVKPKGAIPRMASVDLYVRLVSGASVSEWLPKGKFFISERSTDENGILSLLCYDGMRKADCIFMKSGTWTSTSAYEIVSRIAANMGGLDGDTDTYLKTTDPKSVPYLPDIGTNGTVSRTLLKCIAGMYGGNFAMTDSGKLKLYRLGTDHGSTNLGVQMEDLQLAAADAVGKVTVYYDDASFSAGEDGYELRLETPYASQELANGIHSLVNGFVYQPFKAVNAEIDPAAELGDAVIVNGTTSCLFSQVLDLNSLGLSELSAPFDDEVDDEYPFVDAQTQEIKNSVSNLKKELETELSVLPGEILGKVYGIYSEKWTAATKYYVGDILELTTGQKFYQCIREHTSNSTNMPPNTTYWTEVEAPTGESFINLGLRGITIQNTTTTPSGSNQASIRLTKDGIDIAAGTITMSNVTVDTIAANKITGGYLGADVIYSGSISADNITSGELNADNVSLKGLFTVTDSSDNDAGYIGGFTFGANSGIMYMRNHQGNASISLANLNVGYDVGVVGIYADQVQLKGLVVLDSDSYGTSLPSEGVEGQLFFLI